MTPFLFFSIIAAILFGSFFLAAYLYSVRQRHKQEAHDAYLRQKKEELSPMRSTVRCRVPTIRYFPSDTYGQETVFVSDGTSSTTAGRRFMRERRMISHQPSSSPMKASIPSFSQVTAKRSPACISISPTRASKSPSLTAEENSHMKSSLPKRTSAVIRRNILSCFSRENDRRSAAYKKSRHAALFVQGNDLLLRRKANRHLRQLRLHAAAGDIRRGEHPLRCLRTVGGGVLVREIDDLTNAALNDRLAAFVAREQ